MRSLRNGGKKHRTYHDYMKGGEKVFFFHLKIIKFIVMIYTPKKKKRSWFLTIGKCDKKRGGSWKMMEIKN